jgi:glycosyltransferase involved in cell wall biosynthesis
VPYDELSWYLGCADLFILPYPDKIYNIGRWPNKIGDYLSVGRPIISNPVGDVRTLLQEHNVGSLAEWDPGDFAEKIIGLIGNPERLNKYCENARQLAVKEYNWKVLIQRLEGFYYRILNSSFTQNPN